MKFFAALNKKKEKFFISVIVCLLLIPLAGHSAEPKKEEKKEEKKIEEPTRRQWLLKTGLSCAKYLAGPAALIGAWAYFGASPSTDIHSHKAGIERRETTLAGKAGHLLNQRVALYYSNAKFLDEEKLRRDLLPMGAHFRKTLHMNWSDIWWLIHTVDHPGGAVKAQMVKQKIPVAPETLKDITTWGYYYQVLEQKPEQYENLDRIIVEALILDFKVYVTEVPESFLEHLTLLDFVERQILKTKHSH